MCEREGVCVCTYVCLYVGESLYNFLFPFSYTLFSSLQVSSCLVSHDLQALMHVCHLIKLLFVILY